MTTTDVLSENILTDVLAQNGDLQIYTSTFALAAGISIQVARPQPLRLALILAWDVPTGRVQVTPFFVPMFALIGASSTQPLPLVIHAAAYPGLCQGTWWMWSDLATNLTVYDVTRKQ